MNTHKPNVTPAELSGEAQQAYEVVLDIAQRMHRGHHWAQGEGKNMRCVKQPLTKTMLQKHVMGSGSPIGLCPIAPGETTTRTANLDMDSHKGEVPWGKMCEHARDIITAAREHAGLEAVPFRSTGGSGIHLTFLWSTPQDAYTVRETLREVLEACGLKPGTKGVAKGEVEIFPKQDAVPADGFGSMWILPLARNSVPLDQETLREEALLLLSVSLPVAKRVKTERMRSSTIETPSMRRVWSAMRALPAQDYDYEHWRNIVFAIHDGSEGSREGLACAQEYNDTKHPHERGEAWLASDVWDHIKSDGNGITVATLFKHARDAGWRDEEGALEGFEDVPLLSAEQQAEQEAIRATNVAKRSAAFEGIANDASKPNPYRLVMDDEFVQRKPLELIVRHVLPRGELGVLFGSSTDGKTFVALDLACAIAQGAPWRGLSVARGRVVFVVAEGVSGFSNRLKGYQRHLNVERLGVEVIAATPNLLDVTVVKELAAAIGHCDVIFIDTLAQVTAGADENSGKDMGVLVKHCRSLAQATGALVVLIHHAGKDVSRGARGWSGIKAAADVELEVSRHGEARVITASKMKDGEDGARYPFRLVPVVLGFDEEGLTAIESRVVEHTHEATAAAAQSRQPTSPVQRVVWRAAHEIADALGEAAQEAVLDGAVPKLAAPELGRRDQRRKTARVALQALADRRFLTLLDGRVKLPASSLRPLA